MRLCWIRRWRCGVLQLYRGRWLGAAGGSKTFSSVFQFISAREWGTNRMNIQTKLNVGYDDAFISFHKLQQSCLSMCYPFQRNQSLDKDKDSLNRDLPVADQGTIWNLQQEQGLMPIAMFPPFQHLFLMSTNVQLGRGRKGSLVPYEWNQVGARSRSEEGFHFLPLGSRYWPPPKSKWHCCWTTDIPCQPKTKEFDI